WYCAGNVNNPQALLYRMLNITGGFTTRALNYSCHCISAITPHIVGIDESSAKQTSWENVLKYSKVIIIWSSDMLNTNRVSTSVPMQEHKKYIVKLKQLVQDKK
ncbi:trimethylamine-N-oxide reductase TorA, partial [Campylobacter canadensis]|nr:trimethylamine-N-oxide reductase TorA [Campylobacter canadensis]